MDFHLSEELTAVRDLADGIFADRAGPEQVREAEASPPRTDGRLWDDLARAGLLGIALPERYGGAGLGLGALCVLLAEQGRRAAPVPLWSAGIAALALARHGNAGQRDRFLPAAADGSGRLALALEEFAPAEPAAPECTAVPDERGWTLTGTKAAVPAPDGAAAIVVSASADAGPGLFLVEAGSSGAAWEYAETTDRGWSGHLTLDGARATAIGAPGGPGLPDVLSCTAAALAAVQSGVARGALDLAVGHLAQREQFGRPLGTFQAVQHRLADCFIDTEAMQVTLWQAVTALDGGPAAGGAGAAGQGAGPGGDATSAALVAKYWADQAGLDVVHRTQHLHGGIGVDVEYPAHRYFLWGRQLAGTLGGASAALARLGDRLAGKEVAL
ncbi:acyl-CoA dehydrogenase family protein [Nocardiopsis coralliicola]